MFSVRRCAVTVISASESDGSLLPLLSGVGSAKAMPAADPLRIVAMAQHSLWFEFILIIP